MTRSEFDGGPGAVGASKGVDADGRAHEGACGVRRRREEMEGGGIGCAKRRLGRAEQPGVGPRPRGGCGEVRGRGGAGVGRVGAGEQVQAARGVRGELDALRDGTAGRERAEFGEEGGERVGWRGRRGAVGLKGKESEEPSRSGGVRGSVYGRSRAVTRGIGRSGRGRG
ncbi:MAG: hypothetical protein M5U20_09365 [Phycisphaerales bacterium]|nr:hypothetical protein [Phycisphaerales bacterium]